MLKSHSYNLQQTKYSSVTQEGFWALLYITLFKSYTIYYMYLYRLQIKLDYN
jgi:hypothetical protein